MMREYLGPVALTTSMLIFIVSTQNPRIDNLRITEKSALHITLEYTYPTDNRNYLIAVFNSGGSFGFRRYGENWRVFGEYIVKKSKDYGFEGEVVLPSTYPNSPYVIVKNKTTWKSSRPRYKYYEYDLEFFTIYSNIQLNLETFKIFDEHLKLLARKHGKKINKFSIIYLNIDIPSVIIGDRMILGKPSIVQLLHEFAHVFSLYNNTEIIEKLGYLFKEAGKFAENANMDTHIGHPHSNISELLASIITIYVMGKLPNMNEEERKALDYISSFYMLDELRMRLYEITGERQ